MLDTIITICVAAIAFLAGVRFSERYHEIAEEKVQIALRKQYARLTAGVDADDSAQPYIYAPRPKFSVSHEFISRLRSHGSATMAVNKKKQS